MLSLVLNFHSAFINTVVIWNLVRKSFSVFLKEKQEKKAKVRIHRIHMVNPDRPYFPILLYLRETEVLVFLQMPSYFF